MIVHQFKMSTFSPEAHVIGPEKKIQVMGLAKDILGASEFLQPQNTTFARLNRLTIVSTANRNAEVKVVPGKSFMIDKIKDEPEAVTLDLEGTVANFNEQLKIQVQDHSNKDGLYVVVDPSDQLAYEFTYTIDNLFTITNKTPYDFITTNTSANARVFVTISEQQVLHIQEVSVKMGGFIGGATLELSNGVDAVTATVQNTGASVEEIDVKMEHPFQVHQHQPIIVTVTSLGAVGQFITTITDNPNTLQVELLASWSEN